MVTDSRSFRGLSNDQVIGTIHGQGSATTTLTQDEIVEDLTLAQPYFDAIAREELAAKRVNAMLRPLRGLGQGWDSYRALPVDSDVLNVAGALVTQMVLQGLPFPSLVPTSNGGISLEWTSPGREFAISLRPDQEVSMSAFYWNEMTGIEWELALPNTDERIPSALLELRSESATF
jgi:hypothetical protein